MNSCIFCKIANKETPSFIINENDEFLSFLDINPNTDGVSLVIPKMHFESDPDRVNKETLVKTYEFALETSKKIKEKLKVERVGLAIEGMGVNHFHIKLYPFHGVGGDFVPLDTEHERKFYENYPGYLTTRLGPAADMDKLKKIQELFKD